MRKFYLPFLIVILFLQVGCNQAQSNKDDSARLDESVNYTPDTLVHSAPLDFALISDTLDTSSKVGIRSYEDILDLFDKLNYTPESWQAGIREVPRVYLTTIGPRWGTVANNEITVLLKKRLFFRGLAPLILKANELIIKDRKKLESIIQKTGKDQDIGSEDKKWLKKLARLYKVEWTDEEISVEALNELLIKVDIIPPSLALGQGAEESGWGTSRFAADGNAIYGQWTWGENAMVPEQQRKELGNYGIAAFGSLQESVSAYMLNLNTHNAYSDLRSKRAELRKSGQKVTGYVLAGELTRYSERGEEYVKTLRSLMEYNQLAPTDDAYLSGDPAIYLVPAAE